VSCEIVGGLTPPGEVVAVIGLGVVGAGELRTVGVGNVTLGVDGVERATGAGGVERAAGGLNRGAEETGGVERIVGVAGGVNRGVGGGAERVTGAGGAERVAGGLKRGADEADGGERNDGADPALPREKDRVSPAEDDDRPPPRCRSSPPGPFAKAAAARIDSKAPASVATASFRVTTLPVPVYGSVRIFMAITLHCVFGVWS